MKKTLFLLLLLPALATAKTPVEDDIVDQITQSDSPLYYPNLMLRFNNGDTTLTEEDYHYLYYGFAYQSEYKPLEVNDKIDKVLLLASSLDPYNPSIETLDEIVMATTEALQKNPFSPKLWNLLAYSYGALGDKERETIAFDKMSKIMATIDSSGDGLKEKNPKHVLMFDHAIDIVDAQGLNYSKPKVISRTVEFVPFVDEPKVNGKKVKGFYFDFGRAYWNKPADYTYKRDKTWQFNDLKPKKYK